MSAQTVRVRLEPWSEDGFALLRAANTPEMMAHLGGPEPEDLLIRRHQRYVDLSADRSGTGRMFRIVLLPDEVPVGVIGYWERAWNGARVYETGWVVLTPFQGRGIATAATAAVLQEARAARKHRYLHAFPAVDNAASNAVCRKAGFELLGAYDDEYPPGRPLRSNDWRLDLGPDLGPDLPQRGA
ncbi:GNAT family N-acetyltransferase [Streptomyces sp. NPDC045431]|uniref:GNAT family N-acetyltransferase n=1 Tax=Streptomyces sp. NPDC045431 TaxID=3155613 RepID=UPI0033C98FD0